MKSGLEAWQSQALAPGGSGTPDFPGLGRLHVGDGALLEVDVKTEEVEVVHRFEFHRVAEKVVVDEGLDGGMV